MLLLALDYTSVLSNTYCWGNHVFRKRRLNYLEKKHNRILYRPAIWCPSSLTVMIKTTIFFMHVVLYGSPMM